jgi:hypothetical protein
MVESQIVFQIIAIVVTTTITITIIVIVTTIAIIVIVVFCYSLLAIFHNFLWTFMYAVIRMASPSVIAEMCNKHDEFMSSRNVALNWITPYWIKKGI